MNDDAGASIGQAAALYRIAPSTLRWWEKTGLLPEPPKVNGRRVYDEVALRRIGLVYLCCVTGAMPLSQAVPVTSGKPGLPWQESVRRHVSHLDAELRRLRDARDYLLHLLRCPDEDVVAECTHLEGELAKHTPVSEAVAGGLVAAARSAAERPGRAGGDEIKRPRDEKDDCRMACAMCGDAILASARGRRRKYCSHACRQRRYRRGTEPA
ncbi:MerR family DNA-binding transcriptional regulator [Saccharomonospora sp. NPDC006951]